MSGKDDYGLPVAKSIQKTVPGTMAVVLSVPTHANRNYKKIIGNHRKS